MEAIASKLKQENLRLLVLGGSGRLGGLLRRVWAGPGDFGLDPVWQARSGAAATTCGGGWLRLDPLREAEALRAAVRAAEAVLMLAGPTRGTAAELAVNRDLALATLAAAEGRPVILASSAAVYGAPPPPGLCRETDPLRPVSDYGRAKAAMEAAAAGHPGALVVRIGNVAGADALLAPAAPPGGRVLHILPSGHAPRRSYIGPQTLALALARLARLAVSGGAVSGGAVSGGAVSGGTLPAVLNLALPGVVGMEDLLAAAGESWHPETAPAGVIDTVELEVSRAVALGLVPGETVSGPDLARRIVAELRAEGPSA